MLLQKGVLHAALGSLHHLADRQTSSELRGRVLFVAHDDRLEISSTDSLSWLRTSLKCDGEFSAILPTKPLLEFARPSDRADREGIVEFKSVENGQVVVAVDGAMITLPALPTENYPTSPAGSVLRLNKIKSWCIPDFRDALNWVLLAIGLDETRPAMTGVLFDWEHVVAVDGHRLHRARLSGFGTPTLVAGSSIAALVRVLPKAGVLELHRGGDVLVFRAGAWEMVTKPMDVAQFPPYAQVIPSELLETFHMIVDGQLVKAALRRLPRSSFGHSNSIRLRVNGALEIGTTSENGNASTTVPVVETTHTGADFGIGLNAGYLRDAVSDGEEEIVLRFSGELDPVVVRPAEGRLAVIMPMRV